ncbi:MAG TPA: adenylate/guanylate cyclase domain-containing protein [Stellaceae bacterium]|nr:adenylate/guanylate cyclase domain-containing protein [Stellaceae bacterium]
MRLRLRSLAQGLTPLVVALGATLIATVAVGHLAFLTFADRFLGDWETAALTASEPQNPDIVVVAITEDTLKQFPYRSPIDRDFLNQLLKTLAARAPRAIGLDVLFDQPTEPDKDQRLRQTLRDLNVPMVVSYTDNVGVLSPDQRAYLDEFNPPRLRALADLATDQFDTVRWVYPGRTLADGRYVAGFARALAADVGIETPAKMVDVAWHGRPSPDVPAFREYGAELVPALPADWFKGKIVLIGTDLTLTDRHRTPFATVYEGDMGMMPGIIVHAHGLAQFLEGRSPPAIGWVGNLLIVVACALVGAALPTFGGTMVLRIGAGCAFLVALWLGGGALYHYHGVMIGLLAPTLALAMAHWAMEALSGRDARRQREFITGAFSRYVSPKVVQALIRDPSRMSLEGERRVMSYLFTDLANFTTLSESLESRELAKTLNGYFNGMTEIVLKYDGTICKYEGDAVFVIFNAPVDQPDHAERAVRCALDMDRFATRFSAEKKALGMPFGHTRIGVHTGPAVVGNFGSWARFDYSAIGDSVNTAARLEGVNKQFGTRICVSDATRELCHGIDFRPLGAVVVKGKTRGIAVYEPLHDDDERGEFLARYDAAFAMLKAMAPNARNAFAALHREAPDDQCVALHLERLSRGESGSEIVLTEK